jgi:hypothetical protein
VEAYILPVTMSHEIDSLPLVWMHGRDYKEETILDFFRALFSKPRN